MHHIRRRDWLPPGLFGFALAVPKAAAVMRARGHAADAVRRITLDNPRTFLGQSANFSDAPLRPTAADLGR